jgi:hypothetical protein
MNQTGLIILIIGIILSLAGGGYILYKTYFDRSYKPKLSGLPPPMMAPKPGILPGKGQDPKMMAMQQQRIDQLREQKSKDRKAMIKNLDTAVKDTGEIAKIPEKKPDFVTLDDLKTKNDEKKSDVFSKLARIAGLIPEEPEDNGQKSAEKSEDDESLQENDKTKQSADVKARSEATASGSKDVQKTSEKDDAIVSPPSGKKPEKIRKPKKKKEIFEKLENISTKYTKEEMTKKIAELSGKEENKVSSMLDASLTQKQAISLFDNLDKDKLTSEVFKEILFNLIISGSLSKDSVSNMLFEYMDKGALNKKDVAKIMSDLKLI